MRLRCRLGLHRKRFRNDEAAVHTFLMVGVNLKECRDCTWRMSAIGERRT
jgi:hypothetical protein